MAKKLSTTRKGFAIGLAVVGIAGLSLAAAAQLNLTSTNSVQAGSIAIKADCQKASLTVTFADPTLIAGKYGPAELTISTIDAACAGYKNKIALLDKSNNVVAEIPAGTTPAVLKVPLTAYDANLISSVALTIYG